MTTERCPPVTVISELATHVAELNVSIQPEELPDHLREAYEHLKGKSSTHHCMQIFTDFVCITVRRSGSAKS